MEKIIKERTIEGDIEFEGKLIFENDCQILGDLRAKEISAQKGLTADSIEVKKSTEVLGTLKVFESIRAGGDIKVGWYLEADVGSIKAKGKIQAGGAIVAGRKIKAKSVEAGRYITSPLIEADEILAGKKAKKGEKEFQTIHAREIRGKIVQGIYYPSISFKP